VTGNGTDRAAGPAGPRSRVHLRGRCRMRPHGRTAACGPQADPTVTVPADVAAMLRAHGLDPADPALARCVVTALGVTKSAVPFPRPKLALSRGKFPPQTNLLGPPHLPLHSPTAHLYSPFCTPCAEA
jgi:hypothetical protein